MIPLELESAGWFHNGLAPASRNGKWGYLDPLGNWVIPPKFDHCAYMLRERAVVAADGAWGVIDHKGQTVVPFDFSLLQLIEGATDPSGPWFQAKDGDNTVVFSHQGCRLFETEHSILGRPSDGVLTCAKSYDGPFGYLAYDGTETIPPRFSHATPFCGGLAIVEDGERWAVIDRSDRRTAELPIRLFPACGASPFGDNGLAWIRSLDRFGLLSCEGTIVVKPELDAVNGHDQPLIWVKYPTDLEP